MIKKPYIYKRITAYFIDILLVAMISSAITMFFPSNDKYEASYSELMEIIEKRKNDEITEKEYVALYDEVNYDLSKNSVDTTIVIIAITLLYFVVYNYYSKGETIGKKLMKIKIVSNNDNKLTINNYLLRCLVANTALSNIVSVILILTLSKKNYILYSNKLSTAFSIIYVLCFVFILYRNDGRGLHDLLAGSIVINKKDEEVKEAEIVSEKEEIESKEKTENRSNKKVSKEEVK